jgi:hypothetical protein
MAPRILIFSIAMNADSSFYVKFITTEAPTFFGYIISVLAMVFMTFFITRTKWKKLFISMNYQKVLHFQAKQHEMLHTGEKPYACTVYEKKNQTRENFKRHEKNLFLVAFVIKKTRGIFRG